jgi:hypothetical protein
MKIKLFLDCDGVLADFDAAFIAATGMHPRAYEDANGTKAFWKVISSADNFFGNLPLMDEAHRLYEAVKHHNPTILTGVPHGDWSQAQKLGWRDKYFPGVPMITCRSKDKYLHMEPDALNIIVDDWNKHKHVWEQNNGIFILHTSVDDSIAQLQKLNVI